MKKKSHRNQNTKPRNLKERPKWNKENARKKLSMQPNPPFPPQRSMMSGAHTPTLPIGHATALLS